MCCALTNNATTWTLAIAAAVALFSLAPESAAPGRTDNAAACRPELAVSAGPQAEEEPLDPAQRALVDYLSRRFSVAAEPTAAVVDTAYRAAGQSGLDPLLVLAVISIESRFNPFAESVMGAKGLMQIIPRYHRARLIEHGGEDAVLDPQSNIRVGIKILQEYVHRTGTLEAGLQSYNGASRDESAQYSQRVFAERDRLERVVRGAAAGRVALKGAL